MTIRARSARANRTGFLIDPQAHTVTAITYAGRRHVKRLIGCRKLVEAWAGGPRLYVSGDDGASPYFFEMPGMTPVAGKALVIRSVPGTDLAGLRRKVRFGKLQ